MDAQHTTQQVLPHWKTEGRRRLRVLADFLATVPENLFDLREWFVRSREPSPDSPLVAQLECGATACGTSACAMGWAATIPEFRALGLTLYTTGAPAYSALVRYLPTHTSGFQAVVDFFGLTRQEAEFIAMPSMQSLSSTPWSATGFYTEEELETQRKWETLADNHDLPDADRVQDEMGRLRVRHQTLRGTLARIEHILCSKFSPSAVQVENLIFGENLGMHDSELLRQTFRKLVTHGDTWGTVRLPSTLNRTSQKLVGEKLMGARVKSLNEILVWFTLEGYLMLRKWVTLG